MEQQIRACLDQKRYREAFDLLLPEYQNRVFRLAFAMLGDPAAAEDTAQDVFVRIWKALAGFRGQSSLSTWIYAITRNTCLTALKSAAAKREISIEEPGVGQVVESSAAVSEPATRAGIDLIRLIAELPERHQQVLQLYYMEERSYEEVARLLDLPMGTVKVSLHRARKQLARAAARSKMETGTT
jgi:RNA polymerase sigma-70 factor (ECF subfamily)